MKKNKAKYSGQLHALLLVTAMSLSAGASADGHCVAYAAATADGEGGFRLMDDQNGFKRIKSGGRIEGKICNRDTVRIELSKRDLNAKVGMKINDKRYQFASGDKGDKKINNWYRKYFTVKLR